MGVIEMEDAGDLWMLWLEILNDQMVVMRKALALLGFPALNSVALVARSESAQLRALSVAQRLVPRHRAWRRRRHASLHEVELREVLDQEL